MPAAAGGEDGPTQPGDAGGPGLPASRREVWQQWRHSRPVLGPVLVIAGGLEILVSERAPLPLLIHIGVQGVAGFLIPAIMVLCGVLLLLHPVQRTFYSILAILLALGSWITSNLGGFFVGLLLGVAGGALSFAWQQGTRARSGPSRPRPRPQQSSGITLIYDHLRRNGSGGRSPRRGNAPGSRHRDPGANTGDSGSAAGTGPLGMTVIVALPLAPIAPLALWMLLAPGVRGALPAATPTGRSGAATTPRPGTPWAGVTRTPPDGGSPSPGGGWAPPGGGWAPPNGGWGQPSTSPAYGWPPPTASPRPFPTTSPTPSTRPGSAQVPAPRQGGRQSPGLHHRHTRRHPHAAGAPDATGASARSRLSAGLAVFDGLSFDGIAHVHTAAGVVPMVKLSMNSLQLSGVTLQVVIPGGTSAITRNSALGLTGDVVIYARSISGDAHGVPIMIGVHRVPSGLRPGLVLSHVVAVQPYATAESVHDSNFQVTAG